jgi:hypothetical protein
MSKPRRLCLFCGRPAGSKEHIIAQWIGRSLSDVGLPGVVISFRHEWANPEAGLKLRKKRAKGTAYTTRAFCGDCNNGWMADLEESVKPILEPMLHGRPGLLDAAKRKTLAFWVTKTIFGFQSVEDEITTFVRQQEFDELYLSREALRGSQIWLAGARTGDEMLYRPHSVRLRESVDETADGFGATLLVGHAAFYMLHGYERSLNLRLRASISSAFREIHPPLQKGDQRWPSPGLVDVPGEYGFSRLLINNAVRPSPTR